MVSDRRFVRLAATYKSRRSASDPAARCVRSVTLDVEEWRTLEQFTKILPIRINVSTTTETVGHTGDPMRDLESAGRTLQRAWPDRLGPTFGRWHILSGKKRGELVGRGRKGTGTNVLILMDGDRTPLGTVITPANHHESRHIERLLDSSVTQLPAPVLLIYDAAADNDPLRERLAGRDVELIAPHRKNRVKPPTQDSCQLRRYKRTRWKVERTNAWLHNYGRFTIRKDRLGILFLGWTQLACLFTILKRL